ncbi:hypothetical protein A2Z53_00565 [Candidatus Giovannonibacteria bacterium RIFCSPHIGHO2_02_42_15]|uniref:Uncharacterized protein n=2 Tax=Candidatus Giovannoniibacteriota TaxID=1752738 RepID=A0A1F5VLT2_9BACT|nr:MAG: hypothetical protein UV11_C0006G0052 [Candidatus Giovannonibacteria bacterium GW2011_GWF2_42_19]OGF64365.1 MAG: hypothetical protein A2Z53_00565 [Candidatus Giovannonibacteria bacterium RIFCSPHIGHO2_02_42_15]
MVLPKIDADTGPEIQKEYLENRDYIADVLRRMADENPLLADFIGLMSGNSSAQKEIAECVILVYRLLEKQAEKDYASIQ